MAFKKGHIVSEEIRRKLSESLKGKKRSYYTPSRFQKGHKHSKEVLEKISRANTGHIVSEETKQKIRETNLRLRKRPPSGYGRFKKVNGKIVINSSTYTAVHQWIVREKGRPKKCEMCGTTEKNRYDWANKDHKYARKLEDYMCLCVKCHRKYDKENNNK